MPNHVTNILTVTGERSEAFFESVQAEEPNDQGHLSPIDFDKIVPMPDGLGGAYSYSAVKMAKTAFRREMSAQEILAEEEESKHLPSRKEIRKLISNLAATGYAYWYDWAYDHWGTKWNAYNARRDENTIYFDTAWSTPFSLMKQASEQWPELKFLVKYADEDLGQNCGWYLLKDGTVLRKSELSSTDAGYQFACEVKGWDPEQLS